VHRHSARRSRPFITLDCTTLSGELFESEVFGHARGAFTGSSGEKKGLYELADGGTLFLDEIGEMPLSLQSKLLRVLESGTFRRVGGTRTRCANVRIICATNRELRDVPWFRSDLYYRVACLTVNLPSLADRRADIPLLAAELLRRIGQTSGRWYSIDAAGIDRLMGYAFPGNIRELRNVLWVAAVNAPEGRISAAQIAAALPESLNGRGSASTGFGVPAEPEGEAARIGRRARHVWEADHLVQALRRHNGNRRAAASELGVSERTVYRKLRQLGLG
jgi:transcriptional regulator with GAF, ATPase, and Fis domain